MKPEASLISFLFQLFGECLDSAVEKGLIESSAGISPGTFFIWIAW